MLRGFRRAERGIKATLLIVLSAVSWIGFMVLHTITFRTNYETHAGVFGYAIPALVVMILFLLFWNALKPEEDWMTMQKSMALMLTLAVLYLLLLILEAWTGTIEFYEDTVIRTDIGVLSKKYLFDPIALIVFPLWTQTILRGMQKEEFRRLSVFSGCMQILALTLMSFLMYMPFLATWMINLAFMEWITVAAGIGKYIWPEAEKKRNVLLLFAGYTVLWIWLLSLIHYPGQSFSGYTYGSGWGEYQQAVMLILAGAVPFGASANRTAGIQEFMQDNNNYLLSALYDHGWVPALGILIFLAAFLVLTGRMLGRERKENVHYLVYHAAWWTLALRILTGVPYSFGLMSLRIALPFAGKTGIYMDTIALALLISCAAEKVEIDPDEEEDEEAWEDYERIWEVRKGGKES